MMQFPVEIIVRSIAVYLFVVIAIRLFGKKELSQLTTIDLVLILLIANSVQNAMVGSDISLIGGLVAAGSLFIINYLLKRLIFRSKRFGQFLQGDPVLLIHDGKVIDENLKKLQISYVELEQAAREHGVEKLDDVNLAVLEIDGSISILSNNYHRQTKKKHRVQKGFPKMN